MTYNVTWFKKQHGFEKSNVVLEIAQIPISKTTLLFFRSNVAFFLHV